MFIYTLRASTVKYFAVIAICLVALLTIVFLGGSETYMPTIAKDVNFSGIKTNEDRVKFIEQFNINVAETPEETVEFALPDDFDRIILGYNEIQKSQGLDITKYKNKKVTRYTYRVEKYEDYEGVVYVNLIMYKNNVIACDLSTADKNGFVKPLLN